MNVRQFAGRLLPKGTTRRKAASFALAAFRDARSTGTRLRAEWVEEKELRDPGGRYRLWCRRHDADGDALERQRTTALSLNRPATVLVLIDRGAPDGEILGTLRSLANQSWPHWTAVVVGGDPGSDPTDGLLGHGVEWITNPSLDPITVFDDLLHLSLIHI